MKLRFCLLSLVLLFSLCGCATRESRFLPLDSAFEADVTGTFGEVEFSARVCFEEKGENGARRATLTVYAPSSLEGTVLCRDEEGALTLSVGELSVKAPDAYGELFSLFENRELHSTVREGENTRVFGDEASFLFAKDGTPLEATLGDVSVKILSFSKK